MSDALYVLTQGRSHRLPWRARAEFYGVWTLLIAGCLGVWAAMGACVYVAVEWWK